VGDHAERMDAGVGPARTMDAWPAGKKLRQRLFYSLRSRLLYADKHYSALGSWAVRVLTFAVEGPIRRLHAGAMGGDGAAETAEAYRRLRSE
jgi:hypothetical protein